MGDTLSSGATRREFVGAMAAATLALPVLAGGGAAQAAGEQWIATVKPEELPADSFRLYRRNGFVLARKGDVLFALSIKCTHQQCDVGPGYGRDAKLLACKCHGGQYDAQGKVLKGPPKLPLAHFATRLSKDGVIEVNPGASVQGEDAGLALASK